MPSDLYSTDDLFDKDETSFLKNQPEELKKEDDLKGLEPTDDPLTLVPALEASKDSPEDKSRKIKSENKGKKKPDFDDTQTLKKEIEEAREKIKGKYNYKDMSPRFLRAMVLLYQEHALQRKCPGLVSKENPQMLLVPIIEDDGEHETVVLKAPLIGSLERRQLLPDSDVVQMLKEYYQQHKL